MVSPINIPLRRHLNLLHINIQSLKKKLNELEALAKITKADIITVNETWLEENDEQFFKIQGYDAYFNSREDGYGGSCIYIQNGILVKSVKKIVQYNSIIVELDDTQKNFKIITTYRPPREDCRNFLTFLEHNLLSHKNSIIMCDSNINLLNETCDNTLNYTDLLNSLGYKIFNTLDKASATRSTSATIIDHAFSNATLDFFQLSIQDCSFSDHRSLLLQIKFPTAIPVYTTKTFKKLNKPLFPTLVRHGIDLIENSLERKTIEHVIQIIQNSKAAATSTITKKIRQSSSAWITLQIIESIKYREKLYKRKKADIEWKDLGRVARGTEVNSKQTGGICKKPELCI